MPIDVPGGTRPKVTTTNAQTISILAPAATFDDSGNKVIHYFQLENITPNPVSFTAATSATTNGQPTVTGANLTNVRAGDGVTGTGIPGGTTVLSVESSTSITLSANATATGTPTLTFTPADIDANLFAVVTEFSQSGSEMTISQKTYKADGTVAKGTTVDTSLYTQYTEDISQRRTFKMDIDTFLVNARVAKSS